MRTNIAGAVILRHALWLALLVAGIGCENGPTSPSTTVHVQSIAVTGTPSLRQPGDRGQLTAIATYADGSTKSVTGAAFWSVSSTTPCVKVTAGLVTAIAYGKGEITASFQGASQSVPVRVAPDGAFLIEGRVTVGGNPLSQATVEAASAAGTHSVRTEASGAFILPGAGAVTLHASRSGYGTATVQVSIDRDDKVSLELTREQPLSGLGRYTLTFIASPSCALPADVGRRTYGALLQDAWIWNEPWDLDVSLDGASFYTVWAEPGFVGRMDGATVRFTISDDVNGAYALIEQVGPGMLHFSGTAAGTFSDRGIVATFDGSVVWRGTTVVECRAPDHQLVFTR